MRGSGFTNKAVMEKGSLSLRLEFFLVILICEIVRGIKIRFVQPDSPIATVTLAYVRLWPFDYGSLAWGLVQRGSGGHDNYRNPRCLTVSSVQLSLSRNSSKVRESEQSMSSFFGCPRHSRYREPVFIDSGYLKGYIRRKGYRT